MFRSLVALLASCSGAQALESPASHPVAAVDGPADLDPVDQLLARVIGPAVAARFDLSIAGLQQCGSPVGECATVADGPGGRVQVQATSVPSLIFGIGAYLRERCNATLTWVNTGGMADAAARCGNQSSLPLVGSPIALAREMKWTFYQNVVQSSYSNTWWDWERWQVEIDWMALSGVNIAVMYTGQEFVLRQLYAEHSVNLSEATGNAAFFNGPAFLSWSRGQRQSNKGGLDVYDSSRTGSLPDWWIDQQASLGKKQASRMRELGVVTVLRGFEGNVPEGIALRYPAANISASQLGQYGQAWQLDALDPLFVALSDRYMQLLVSTFGTSHFYGADGSFSCHPMPWLATAEPEESIVVAAAEESKTKKETHEETEKERPACVFSARHNMSYVGNCAPLPAPHGCGDLPPSATLADAEEACQKDLGCGGIVLQCNDPDPVCRFTTRANRHLTPSPKAMPSASWLITNADECHGPTPTPPSPPPPNAEAKRYAQAAYAGMARIDPEATWVYQTWGWHWSEKAAGEESYLRGWLSGVPKEKHLLLDQSAEMTAVWQFWGNWRYDGHPFIWMSMSSMGGNLGLYGDLGLLNTAPLQAHQSVELGGAGDAMAGIGADPEGIDNNPAYWQLLLDSAWRSAPINTSDFLQTWGDRRCGMSSAKAAEAWALLGETVYASSPAQRYEHHMAYCPTAIFGGGEWDKPQGSESPTWYESATLHKAWGLLIDAAKSECASPLSKGFIFDLVDVGREYLSIEPCNQAQSALGSAATAESVVAANASMSELMADLDRLLGASDGFLLGRWVGDARALAAAATGGDDSAKDFLEWNARSQVTTWVPSEGCDGNATVLGGLYDYGNKAWAGLVKGYYDRRYQIFADSKLCQLQPSRPGCLGFSYTAQLMQLACEFQRSTDALPAAALGDALAISEELFQKYAPKPEIVL